MVDLFIFPSFSFSYLQKQCILQLRLLPITGVRNLTLEVKPTCQQSDKIMLSVPGIPGNEASF